MTEPVIRGKEAVRSTEEGNVFSAVHRSSCLLENAKSKVAQPTQIKDYAELAKENTL